MELLLLLKVVCLNGFFFEKLILYPLNEKGSSTEKIISEVTKNNLNSNC
jgi:hypothetical protein